MLLVQECPSVMVRDCSTGTGWRGAATSTGRGRRTVTASRIVPVPYLIIASVMTDDVRNNCEMTHFFFSLIREPLQEQKLMPLVFYFDTHIITQVTLNVRHTFFDKVRLQTSLSTDQHLILTFAKVSAIGGTFGLFCGVSVISLLELLYYLVVFLWRATSRKKKMESSEKLMLQPNNRFN